MKTKNQIKASQLKLKALRTRAFSLIELLVVIAVIGIIAAIAIPNIASITGGAQLATAKRNAQTIASVSSSARAAGYVFVAATAAPATAVGELITGVPGPDIANSFFKIDMDPGDVAAALVHADYTQAGGFVYDPQ